MNILRGLCNQRCVYWAPTTVNKYREQSYATPVELACKWTAQKSQATDSQGNKITLSATVYFFTEGESITPPVEVGGVLWFGILDNVPSSPPEKQKIRTIDSTPDTESGEVLYTVGL